MRSQRAVSRSQYCLYLSEIHKFFARCRYLFSRDLIKLLGLFTYYLVLFDSLERNYALALVWRKFLRKSCNWPLGLSTSSLLVLDWLGAWELQSNGANSMWVSLT